MTDPHKVIDAKKRMLEELDNDNGEVFDEIQKHAPGFQMDTRGLRLELLIEFLKNTFGDEEAWLDFELQFHLKVKEALAGPLEQLQQTKRRQGLAIVKDPKKGSGLVDGHGRPIKT